MCVVCCVLCVAKVGWTYSVVNCDMERQDYQVLQENDVSCDLNMDICNLEKLPERVSG